MSRVSSAVGVCLLGITVCLALLDAPAALGQPGPAAEEAELTFPSSPLDAAPPSAPAELPSVAPPQGAAEQGLFAMLLGRGPQAGLSPRLAGVPNMFGDFFGLGSDLEAFGGNLEGAGGPLPLAAASRRAKVAENNKALPMDRVHFMYNHFANALDIETAGFPGGVGQRAFSVDRFTLGIEKSFFHRRYSVEVRMPLASYDNYDGEIFGVSGGELGNLAVLFKRVLFQTPTTSAVIGLGVDLPTGDDVDGFVGQVNYTMRNESVHLLPFVGITGTPCGRVFYHTFLQIDVPTNGNSIEVSEDRVEQPTAPGDQPDDLNEQTAMYVDIGTGYWLLRRPCARGLTGLAAVVEVHYATTLSDADTVSYISPVDATALYFGNTVNRLDQVNFSVGLHAELCRNTTLRVGGVFPISDGDDRSFDSELQVQVGRRF